MCENMTALKKIDYKYKEMNMSQLPAKMCCTRRHTVSSNFAFLDIIYEVWEWEQEV